MPSVVTLLRTRAVSGGLHNREPLVPAGWEVTHEDNGFTIYPNNRSDRNVVIRCVYIARIPGTGVIFIMKARRAVLQRVLPRVEAWWTLKELRTAVDALAVEAKAAWPDDRERPRDENGDPTGPKFGPRYAVRRTFAGFELSDDAEATDRPDVE